MNGWDKWKIEWISLKALADIRSAVDRTENLPRKMLYNRYSVDAEHVENILKTKRYKLALAGDRRNVGGKCLFSVIVDGNKWQNH